MDTSNMENLIREFEKGSISPSKEYKYVSSPPSSSSQSVKKMIEAYELRAMENARQEDETQRKRKSDYVQNGKEVFTQRTFSGSTPMIYHKSANNSPTRSTLSKNLRVYSVPDIEAECNEMDFAESYDPNAKKGKRALIVGPKVLPNITSGDLPAVRSSSLLLPKKNESWSVIRKNRIFYSSSKSKRESKSSNKPRRKLSSPLKNSKDKCGQDTVDNILSHSCASSNSSYKNLQINLYDFKDDEWQSSSSSFSVKSKISPNDASESSVASTSRNITVNSSYDSVASIIPTDGKPHIIGAYLKFPIKISRTSVTWIPTLNGKLPRKKSLKELISVFTSRRRRVGVKSKKKQKKQQRIENMESESSSSSRNSWYSEPDISINYRSSSPTFETFGHTNRNQVNGRDKMARMVLTELPREDLVTDPGPFKVSSRLPEDCSSTSREANHWNVGSPSESAIVTSSPRSKIPYHLSLPKHPYLSRKKIPKHPFVSHAEVDEVSENAAATRKEAEIDKTSDISGLNSSIMSSYISASITSTSLNISSPISHWMASSPKSIHDTSKWYNYYNMLLLKLFM